jgi:hypothetical protein
VWKSIEGICKHLVRETYPVDHVSWVVNFGALSVGLERFTYFLIMNVLGETAKLNRDYLEAC